MALDIIIPCYNEEGNVETLYNTLSKTLTKIDHTLIFIDDGSIDNTYDRLNTIYNKDKKHVKVISFSRNFGKEAAMFAGLDNSTSEYVCIIDGDMQQNPKYILDMLNFLEDNEQYDEVAMINDYNDKSFIQKILKKSFYKIMSKASGQNTVEGASDFRMFRRCVVEAITSMRETNRFSKGIFAWVGFNTYYMPYKVEKRLSGESKFKFRRQISYATDGILNFSAKPLKIATILGTIFSCISVIYIFEILLQTIINGKDIPGYASMMCVILLLGGIQLLVLGIIGEYLSRSYIENKDRPIYIAKKQLGFKDNKDK